MSRGVGVDEQDEEDNGLSLFLESGESSMELRGLPGPRVVLRWRLAAFWARLSSCSTRIARRSPAAAAAPAAQAAACCARRLASCCGVALRGRRPAEGLHASPAPDHRPRSDGCQCCPRCVISPPPVILLKATLRNGLERTENWLQLM
jgi:hypothetical protein